MVRGETRDRETCKPVAKPAFQNKTPNKSRWSGRRDAQHRRAPAFFKHLLRGEWRVTLADHAVVMSSVRRGVVEQLAADLSDARALIHLDRLVNVTLFPAALGPVEET